MLLSLNGLDHTYSLIQSKSIDELSSVFLKNLSLCGLLISPKQGTVFTSHSHNG